MRAYEIWMSWSFPWHLRLYNKEYFDNQSLRWIVKERYLWILDVGPLTIYRRNV